MIISSSTETLFKKYIQAGEHDTSPRAYSYINAKHNLKSLITAVQVSNAFGLKEIVMSYLRVSTEEC